MTMFMEGASGVFTVPELASAQPYLASALALLWVAALSAWLRVVRSIARDQEQLVASVTS